MFKIVAPFVILASAFATLNARLNLPPFSLFLIALTITDGEWRVSLPLGNLILDGTQLIWRRHDRYLLFQSHRHRIVVGDRPIDQFLLHNFFVARLVRGDLCVRGEFDGWNVGRTSCSSEGGVMALTVRSVYLHNGQMLVSHLRYRLVARTSWENGVSPSLRQSSKIIWGSNVQCITDCAPQRNGTK